MNQEQHEMVLELTHASGMQGWYCPICGQRILFLVPPDGAMVIVQPGDLLAKHSGGIGGLHVDNIQMEGNREESEPISEERLRPWMEAINNLNLNW